LDAFGEGAEVGDALEFVIGQLDAKMLFEAREEIERLEAIDAELLEEVVAGIELRARNFEVIGGKLQDFFGGSIERRHELLSCHSPGAFLSWAEHDLCQQPCLRGRLGTVRPDARDLLDKPFARVTNFEGSLQVHPKTLRSAEVAGQSDGRIGGNAALFKHDIVDTRHRDMKALGKLVGREAQRFRPGESSTWRRFRLLFSLASLPFEFRHL
jgi:hypothetical protein